MPLERARGMSGRHCAAAGALMLARPRVLPTMLGLDGESSAARWLHVDQRWEGDDSSGGVPDDCTERDADQRDDASPTLRSCCLMQAQIERRGTSALREILNRNLRVDRRVKLLPWLK